jgi:quercetin dioxygenase-like cupin family protein
MSMPEEAEGGDPPCWAHLFDDASPCGEPLIAGENTPVPAATPLPVEMRPVDLAAVAQTASTNGAVWSHQSEELNVNLLVFAGGEGVAEHVNTEVDVLLVGISGEGVVDVDDTPHSLRAGHALVISKGTRRGTRGLSDSFAYLSCHRRRAGLWPSR